MFVCNICNMYWREEGSKYRLLYIISPWTCNKKQTRKKFHKKKNGHHIDDDHLKDKNKKKKSKSKSTSKSQKKMNHSGK